ncbi:MAG: DUF4160 domain-containing protein [Bacteroidales bacterium]|nr:DUF4160 domain-containing protein [Bacteroidales bacterium]
MSPLIYYYKGIEIRFFSADHHPFHFHAIDGNMQVKVVFYFTNGNISKIVYREVKGYRMFNKKKLNLLKKLISAKKYDIIEKYKRLFILKEKVKPEIIDRV